MANMEPDVMEILSSTSDLCVAASRLKDRANEFFKKADYARAEERYSLALSFLDDTTPNDQTVALMVTVLSNRAQCSLNQGHYDEALQGADEAVGLDPTHAKSQYRRALAALHLKRNDIFRLSLDCLKDIGKVGEVAELEALVTPSTWVRDGVEVVVLSASTKEYPCSVQPALWTDSGAALGVLDIEGIVCPTLTALGMPFRLYAVPNTKVDGDNPFLEAVMMDPTTLSTPLTWKDPRTAVVLRRDDNVSVTPGHVWALWDYIHSVLEAAKESPASAKDMLHQEAFLSFVHKRKISMLQW
eukprot:PhM_4_TR7953/c0_g1_i1/m.2927